MMPVSPLHTPAKLGRYEILDEIGKGAMGVVYLAKDPLIGRLVALKTFRIGYSVKDSEMEQFRARFRREAQSAGILSHPNIVTIHDVVEESEEGVAFIAMEYVRGTNLKVLLQGPMPLEPGFVAGVVDQVADALDYAHSRGVVHRDVKPANIIITADNRVKITDFGIARLDSSNLTQEGQLLGTPNYMSPEQILGKEVDHRADIFSLGVVLYEMLTRHKPFQGENLTVVSHRIVYDQFTPPADYVRELPPGVEAILAKALDKDPGRRYQRACDMADDLRRILASRDADEVMNATQNLASSPTAVLPAQAVTSNAAAATLDSTPPPVPPSLPAVAGDSTAVAAVAVTPAVPAVPAPGVRRSTPSWSRLTTIAWVTGIAVVLAAVAAWLYVDWRQPVGRVAPPVLAAPPVAPVPAAVSRERQQRAAAAAAAAALRQQIDGMLGRARQAVVDKQLDLAAAEAHGVLTLDAANADAAAILAALPKPQEPAAKAPPKPTRVARTPPPAPRSAAQPAAPIAPPVAPAPVPTDAKLAVHLYSQQSSGILMIYLGDKQLMRDPFDFSEKESLFRRKPGEGYVDQTFTLPAGAVTLRVYVTPTGQRARVQTLSGNLPGGSQRRLSIQLDRDGNLTAHLE